MLTVFSGGTGTPKLLQGLKKIIPEKEITVIANTGEDVKISGVHISPDLDTVIYTLADIIDDEKWYGIRGDSFKTHEMLKNFSYEELLKIGDKDRGVKLYRTIRMKNGANLSEVTEEICQGLEVKATVLPMSNDSVKTRVITNRGGMTFHEYWVARGAKDKVKDVNFLNSDKATPAPGVIEALNDSEAIIIGPSNPITSLGPILSIDGIRSTLKKNRDKALAISPIIGDKPVSGPTGHLMKGLDHEVTPKGVAKIYQEFISKFLLHHEDKAFRDKIEKLSIDVKLANILIPDMSSRVELAEKIIEILNYKKNS
ncbi:hypothetical protein AKJ49_00950 [candidate division MSBL1 archaeon SCGC-AAA382A03]|uniref:2-phospho-L-lactate transferase n=1 Tax=candidate division MSBL1 archaeon SCGC-AAA382A03 TaxID=1698278 RepID=A0A133VG19_9EURY|nr:hypothetical protein AKJ49_00950 [candidate division MSBL1 archaeon SCGC-AAA382A03]